MNHKLGPIVLVTAFTLFLLSIAAAVAQEPTLHDIMNLPASPDDTPGAWSIASQTAYTYTTVITVNSGKDINDSKSESCASQSVCTLRRAIVQSRLLSESDLPVLIRFDIPQDPAEGYDSSLQIWKINVYNTLQTSIFRRLKGQVIIDGATQPNGRTAGPKIIIVGPGTGQKDGLIVGDVAGHNNIVIRGLAFQNLRTHIIVNTSNNLIEANWFGLNDDGTGPLLRNDNPEDGSGSAGISLNGSPTNNVISGNTFLGFDGVATAIRGEGNRFENNLVGTKADGTVDKQTDPSLICTTVDWLGGGGVSVADDSNRIENNVFAGLRQEIFQISTQPDAIRIGGDNHVIQGNNIGVDKADTKVGVCGRGIYLAGADTPDHTQVLSNKIVNPQSSAISINGVLADANTLRSNVIEKTTDWPQIQGNPEPEAAIQFGPTVPDALRNFKPARVTSIQGTTVSGTSGASSSCPNCTIELFLDDTDSIIEALQSLTVVTANSNGNWTATLPFELQSGQGIRATSTTAQFNTIANMNAGTTTNLSELYGGDHTLFLPLLVR